MMTLEQIGLLAMLWHEAEVNWVTRVKESRPYDRAFRLKDRRLDTLRRAIRDYKLLQEAKGK